MARSSVLVISVPAILLGTVEAGTVLTVDFSDGPTYQTTSSFIDESATLPGIGTAHGSIDATLGIMRAMDASVPPQDSRGFFQINDILDDEYHLRGSTLGSTTITVHLTADGTITMPSLDSHSDPNAAVLSLAPGNGGTGSANVSLTTNPNFATNGFTLVQPGTYSITETSTFDVSFSGSQGRQLMSEMSLYALGGASLDFFATAKISFDLPEGTSMISDGGFFQSSSVPEPPTSVLLISALPIIAVGLWHRWRLSRGRST